MQDGRTVNRLIILLWEYGTATALLEPLAEYIIARNLIR